MSDIIKLTEDDVLKEGIFLIPSETPEHMKELTYVKAISLLKNRLNKKEEAFHETIECVRKTSARVDIYITFLAVLFGGSLGALISHIARVAG